MSTPTTTPLPVGDWTIDATHSTASFAVRHMGVSTFRGRFEDLDAALRVGDDGQATLSGSVRATRSSSRTGTSRATWAPRSSSTPSATPI